MTLNRRKFLTGTAALATTASLTNVLGNFSALAAGSKDYKAIVCLFMLGGLDNHDTILPYDQPSYDKYAKIRKSLLGNYPTRARNKLLPINQNNTQFGSRRFALPPEMAELHSLFENGNAAIVGNVGPLLKPVTQQEVVNGHSTLPTRLFSHNDQQSTWTALDPEGAQLGWGGKFADVVVGKKTNGTSSLTAVSTTGNEVFLNGKDAVQYQVAFGDDRQTPLLSGDTMLSSFVSPKAKALFTEHFKAQELSPENLIEKDISTIHSRGLHVSKQVNSGLKATPALDSDFPNTMLGRQLKTISETINMRDALKMRRQVFYVGIDGFDTHSSQVSELPNLQIQISQAVDAFFKATQKMGIADEVTLFTASEFGRTLTVNGDGTDHGWGGHHFVIGGAVKGNKIYGTLPPAELGHDRDAGQGRLIPDVSVEQYAATLGNWFGLSDAELARSLPNLSNFPEKILGFL